MKNFLLALVAVILTIPMLGIACAPRIYVNDQRRTLTIEEKQASAVVTAYMNHTLGTLPTAQIDYEKAKALLVSDLAHDFQSAAFIPVSYCMQEGPAQVRIVSAEFADLNNWIEVEVEGQYGKTWQSMWRFHVISDDNGGWLINEIECLN